MSVILLKRLFIEEWWFFVNLFGGNLCVNTKICFILSLIQIIFRFVPRENDPIASDLLVARRATYVVDGRFFAHFFWKVKGTVRIHVNSRVAHVWLPCRMVGGGGIPNFGKLRKFGKVQIFIKVVGSISGHIGSHEWQPS